jgi:hypothetical protein
MKPPAEQASGPGKGKIGREIPLRPLTLTSLRGFGGRHHHHETADTNDAQAFLYLRWPE